MNGHGDRIAARNKALDAALAIFVAERSIGTDEKAIAAVAKAEEAFDLSCRDVVDAVDDLPPLARPKGWARTPDGETA